VPHTVFQPSSIKRKKTGRRRFLQWLEDGRLHIRIRYRYKTGERIEEEAVLRQNPELIQEHWSWHEIKGRQLEREFTVDFKAQTATAKKRENGELRNWSEKIEVQPGQTFAGFGFTLALQNLRKRLLAGERIELQAIGFRPKPTVVSVELSYGSNDEIEISDRSLTGDHFIIHPKIPAIASIFVKVPDTRIWLTKPPAGFPPLEGPQAEPGDPMIRVDLIPGAQSLPAKPRQTQDSTQKDRQVVK